MHQVTLDGTAEDVQTSGGEDSFKVTFCTSIADLLDQISLDMVTVTSLTYGSIIVEFYISSGSASADLALSTALQERLGDGDSPVMIAGRGVTRFTTTQPTRSASLQNSLAATSEDQHVVDDDGGGVSTAGIALLALVLCGGAGSYAFVKMQKSKESAENSEEKNSQQIFNPMNAPAVETHAVMNPMGAGANSNLQWKEVVDKSSGKTYYVHRQTKETTWNRPAELGAQPGVPGVDGGDSEWKEVIDKNSGRPYYVHRQTKETRWDRPADLSPALESATTQLDALDALDALEVEAVETVEIDLGADIETPDDV